MKQNYRNVHKTDNTVSKTAVQNGQQQIRLLAPTPISEDVRLRNVYKIKPTLM